MISTHDVEGIAIVARCGSMTRPDVLIRRATPTDADAIRTCVDEAYTMYIERIGKKPAPMLADYDELIARSVVSVALIDDVLVGMIAMWSKQDHFYIETVAVAPGVQGTGIGAALLAHADLVAEAAGHAEIRLYTNVNMAENLDYYPRRGFTETHRATDEGYERVYFCRHLQK